MNEQVQVAPRDNPYFGLEYYDEQFGAWFFGRETEGSKIITNLRAARLTLLHAESGVGKSSLLRAGVAWRMRRLADDMFARHRPVRSIPVVFTSWKDDPCRDLAGCVGQAIGPYLAELPAPALPTDRLDLAIEVASGAVNASLLIMLDQFEEYFLYRSREPVPERFADELARCINRTDLRANFLIAIREDAYAGLGDLFKGRIPNVYGNYLHIDNLDRASAERAIREPLGVYNSQRDPSQQVGLQDDLVEAVLDEVRAFGNDADARPGQPAVANGNGSTRIATPLLQLVMERVWNAERAEGSHELRLATLQKLRGVKMIADAHLGKALDSLGSAERQTAIDMFDHLVTPSGGKIAESVSDLSRRTGHSEEQVSTVLAKLDHERIVRPIPAAPGQDPMRFRRYEIFHDVLAPTINRAIAAREEQRRVRRIKRFAALAVVLLVIMSAITVSFAYLAVNANNQKHTAESRQLAAEAFLNATSNPGLSAQLALAALDLRYTAQAEDALRAALPGLQTVRTLQNGTGVLSAAFDPADDNKVLSSDYAGDTWIWNVATGKRLFPISLGGSSTAYVAGNPAFNPAGTEVAAGYDDGTVALFDARTGKKLQSATNGSGLIYQVAFVGNTGTVAIASEGDVALWQPGSKCCDVLSNVPAQKVVANPRNPRQFVAITSSGTAVILNTSGSGKPQQQVRTHGATASVRDAGFSPDGGKIVTAESDGSVNIYDLADLSKPATTLNAGEADAWTVAFSPHGNQIVAGYSSGAARVWDVATRLPLTKLAGNAGPVTSAQFSAGGNEVVTASEDGTIRVWHAQPRELRAEFTIPPSGGTPNPILGAAFARNRIIAVDVRGQAAVFTAGGEHQADLDNNATLTSAALNLAGTKMVTADANEMVTMWQAAGPGFVKASRPAPTYVSGLQNVSMSADGSRFADETIDGTIQIRSADTGQILHEINTLHLIDQFELSPNGHQVVAGSLYGQVEVWNGTAAKTKMLGSPGPQVLDVEYNPSGSEFLTTAASGRITVWDTRDNRLLNSINACPSAGTAEFSPDGSKILVACGDGTLRVFETTSGRTLSVIQVTTVGIVSSADFSKDGKSIVTAIGSGNTGCVEVWDAELATPSLATLERIAEQRVQKLTSAQRQQYLNGADG
jgi:WD40 repeat protein